MKVREHLDYIKTMSEEKYKIAPGKGAIYLNHEPKSPNSPRYSGKVRMPNGTLNKFSFWFNGTPGQEGFNVGIAIEEVNESEERALSQNEQKEGWAKVKANLNEGEAPSERTDHDDVPF